MSLIKLLLYSRKFSQNLLDYKWVVQLQGQAWGQLQLQTLNIRSKALDPQNNRFLWLKILQYLRKHLQVLSKLLIRLTSRKMHCHFQHIPIVRSLLKPRSLLNDLLEWNFSCPLFEEASWSKGKILEYLLPSLLVQYQPSYQWQSDGDASYTEDKM